ncbi:hypothetical protein DFA_08060 [Cavenderia fasciculata]|uniref:Pleckstrin domain-containing protein n=1 Tax=Cavenderia fasciculata TaxID=261658 RepID=F4Q4X2_CACFS|nr:uncharacterized protein DFA_08060 [Cavenderia fasciculata]EGG17078.1 hypothetical protein DFA_08060 [Cavenderia fasciculata]|eukprot:XP_004355562.1 hypothetical protein DFA_08060 [Cavenderia fasciculata]
MTLINVNDQVIYDTDLHKAVVVFRYDATEEEELSLVEGAYIDILEEASDGWWRGLTTNVNRQEGIFPFNYVRRITVEEFDIYLERVKNNNSNSNYSTSPPQQQQQQHISTEEQEEQEEQEQEQESEIETPSSSYINHNHNHHNNNNNDTHKLEHHIIASLSDPLEKRSSATSTSSYTTNNNNNNNTYDSSSTTTPSSSSFFQPLPPTPTSSSSASSSSEVASITIKINDIAKEGYLVKRGHIRKNWKVRWFQLKRNRLTYSKSPKENKINELVLTPDTEIDIATSMKRTNCFQIKIPLDKSKDKHLIFYCSAQSPDELESWIHALNQSKNNN